MVWCSITIPISQEAGSEPGISLVLAGDGIESRGEVTLLVDTVKEVEWTMVNYNEARKDTPTIIYLELRNSGNVAISNRIVTEAPEDWEIRILDGILVTLQPGEVRSVQVEFTPDSGSDGSITMMLANAEDTSGQSKTLAIDVISESNGGGSGTLIFSVGEFLLIAVAAVFGALAFSRAGGNLSSIIPSRTGPERPHKEERATHEQQSPLPGGSAGEPPSQQDTELQRFPDYPGWLWDPSNEQWVADPEYDQGEQ